ncbi:MAG: sensor histidine kinase [Pedobacter sp.]|uniref:histidine kinase dimerization/phosphoacceptor domain -containing protein n=1 Tax=Pedobacter sp. TaxID=1411316 RepID=UPI0033950E71
MLNNKSIAAIVSYRCNMQADTLKISQLLKAADRHLFKEDYTAADLDSAEVLIDHAMSLSNNLPSRESNYNALTCKAVLALRRKDYQTADQIFTQVADYFHVTNLTKEAALWEYYADQFASDDQVHIPVRAKCYDKSYPIYKKLGNRLKTADALGKMADIDLNTGRYDSAEVKMLHVLQEYKALKFVRIYYAYYILGEIYLRSNNIKKEIIARIQCLNSFEADPNGTTLNGALFTAHLAAAYFLNRDYGKAKIYYSRMRKLALQAKSRRYYYYSLYASTKCQVALKQPSAGIAILKEGKKVFPPKTISEKAVLLSAELRIRTALQDNRGSAALIDKLMPLFDQLLAQVQQSENFYAITDFINNYETIPNHYIQTGNWQKLSSIVKKLEKIPTAKLPVSTRQKLLEFTYKADSASGNLAAALIKFQTITAIKDSLSRAAAAREVSEMEIKYRTVRKDKTIQNLSNQSLLQKERIAKINTQRNATLTGIVVAVLFAVLMFVAYRGKQRSNTKLWHKQTEINDQNHKLSALINEKESLLEDKDSLLAEQADLIAEKEWLLKEIHHRVKNNLQIVMSLLYTQSVYLQNPDAIEAIRDTQNRVQAISIIHQKLYSRENNSAIVAAEYISDLCAYLSNFYGAEKRKVKIVQIIAPVVIDISQAVPIGLIINESLTNAIKYAFGSDGGQIEIELHRGAAERISLTIADNGRGLPDDFSLEGSSSLGMEMMKALSKQLGGSFKITASEGVRIQINFSLEHKARS